MYNNQSPNGNYKLIKIENENIFRINSSEDYFKGSPNHFLYDHSYFFDPKDFGSIFRTSSNESMNDNNFLNENFDDYHSCYENFHIENNERSNLKNLDSLSIILHIKTMFYNRQFDEILKFFTDNYPNVSLIKYYFLGNKSH